jgi:hypothetical protein
VTRRLALVASAVACATGVAGCGGSGPHWRFTPDAGVRVRQAVSADALRRPNGSILLYANTLKGIEGYRSRDGLSLLRVGGRMPFGAHPTVVSLPDGRLRLYYATPDDPPLVPSHLRSAVSRDGVFWFLEDGVRFGDVGFGVMEVVPLADGTWRLYYNDRRLDGTSRILSARSTAGLTFHREPGVRVPAPYVDPAVVPLGADAWLMAISTIQRGRRQQIFLAQSRDGLNWRVAARPILADADASVFDPTLLPLGDGRFRLYYTRSQGRAFEVRSGILRRD